MDDTTLNALSKDELIALIKDLHSKYLIGGIEGKIVPIDYRSLLEATSDIIFVIDRDGDLVYINSAWKAYFPSWAGRKLGGHYLKNIPPIEKERAEFVFNEIIHKGTSFENEIMKTYDEDGNKIYMAASLSPIRADDGTVVGLVGIMKNITEKHLAEKKAKEYSRILEIKVKEQIAQAQELKGLRDFNEDIINHAPVGIFVMDPSGVVMSENPALKKIMGHEASDTLVGFNLLGDLRFTKSELGKLYEKTIADRRTNRAFNIPYRALFSDRDLIINATVIPIFNPGGTLEKAIFMVEDHTEQAVITNRVYQAEKLSALGILASGIASELRASVNKMVMDLNFVDNNLEEGSPASEYVDSLQNELSRIKNMMEQLVSLSTADDESAELCDLNAVLSSHPVEVVLKRLRADGYEIILETSQDKPLVRATQNQIQQILLQFIENAEEAMPDKGTIRISIETRKTNAGSFALLTIEDTGIGIPQENFQKIFQPFFTTKGKQATGLGLMITSAIVQNLGGTIGVKSEPGEGTTFRVALPLAEVTA